MTNGKQPKPFSQAYEYFDNQVFKKEGYCDYHNHLGGVLPYQELYKFYTSEIRNTEKNFKKECDELKVKVNNFLRFNSEVGLFLRTTYYLVTEKYRFEETSEEPLRGAHAAMLAVFYLYLFAIRADILRQGHIRDIEVLSKPEEIIEVLKGLLSYCYLYCRDTEKKDLKPECVTIAKKAFRNYVRAMRYSPFDDGYVGRGAYLKMFDKATAKDTYGKESLDWLKKNEKITYAEMSQPCDKIPTVAGHRDYNWCKWLLLTAKHREYLAGMSGKNAIEECKYLINQEVPKKNTYIGIDLAGPEGYEYKQNITNTFVATVLKELQTKAKSLNRNLVFRPHVGEGSSIFGRPEKGRSLVELDPVLFVKKAKEGAERAQLFMEEQRKKKKPVLKGVTTAFFDWLDKQTKGKTIRDIPVREFTLHGELNKTAQRQFTDVDKRVKQISINNIDVFINALKKAGYPDKFGNVIVRFGHVTHVQPKQAEEMAKLRIGADMNLGSNLRTGSITFLGGLDDAQQRSSAFGKWNQDWTSLVDRGHGLMNLLDNSVWVGLGSDGQGAEETGIYYEYHMAEEYLKEHGYNRMILQPKVKMEGESAKSYRNWTKACCQILQSNAALMKYEVDLTYQYRCT